MPHDLVLAKGHDRTRSLGWLSIAWQEHFCIHGPGDIYGQAVHLDDELAGLVLDAYALGTDGRRLYNSVFFSRPKGRDKSGQAARFCLFEALGPCRFIGFAKGGEVFRQMDFEYEYQPGEPMGAPITSPVVRIMATEEGQTGNIYDAVHANMTDGALAKTKGIKVGLTGIMLPAKGQLVYSTASSASKDGGKETHVAFDEALALDTPLPTPTGWTTMGEICEGDYLIGSNGVPTRVIKATEIQADRSCWEVTFSDKTSIVASDGHLWETKLSAQSTAKKIRTTKEMVEDGRKFRVPRMAALQSSKIDLPIDPYILGLWLGDGDKNNATVSAGASDTDAIILEIRKRGYTAKITKTAADKANNIYLSLPGSHRNRFSPVKGLKVKLREEGLLGNKHIPDQYLRAGTNQRMELLRGLMDSDGHIAKEGNCTFVQTKREIVDGIVELLRSLGQVANIIWVADSRSRAGGLYKVHFTPHQIVPFSLPRKMARAKGLSHVVKDWVTITSIKPVESAPVRCVAVDAEDHLFAAGLGWQLTHNTHLYTSPELHRMYSTVRRNAAKRKSAQPWSFEASTMYAAGENSVAEESHRLATAIREGRSKKSDFMFDHRGTAYPSDEDLKSDRRLKELLRDAYGKASEWTDIDRILSEFRDPRNKLSDSIRYFLNCPTVGSDAYMDPARWEAAKRLDDPLQLGEGISLGFDGSRTDDSTFLIATRIRDKRLFPIAGWEKPPGADGDGWSVPRPEVDEVVRQTFGDYKVGLMYCDPSGWQSYIDAWAVAFPDQIVEVFPTSQRKLMSEAIDRFKEDIFEGRVTHNGSPILTRHMLNAQNARGGQIGKPRQSDKIDAAVAAILSLEAASQSIELDYAIDESFY